MSTTLLAVAIFRTERGRMRNLWFPEKRAEYMTPRRFLELGLTRDAVGQRDPTFTLPIGVAPGRSDVEAALRRPALEIQSISVHTTLPSGTT